MATSHAFVIEGGQAAERFALTGASAFIGRAPDNSLVLTHPTVSFRHARVQRSGSGLTIQDLGSANGTWLNGEELSVKQPRLLRAGDTVVIGPFQLTYLDIHATDAGPVSPVEEVGQARAGQTVVLPALKPARLVVSWPAGSREVPLRATAMTLGRDPDNDIVIDAEVVSRRHARIVGSADVWTITDLGSTNGLCIDGHLVQNRLLQPGDVVEIGRSVRIQFLAAEGVAVMRARAAGPGAEGTAGAASVAVPAAGDLVIGRGPRTGITITHPQISLQHAKVRREPEGYVIEDLDSTTGVFVNGQAVQRRLLHDGDVVRIGPDSLVFTDGRLEVAEEPGLLRLDAFNLDTTVGKGVRILRQVSLSILPHEFVALVGTSGSGKSTLMNALCGFRPATSGTVLLNGTDLYDNFDSYRNALGYVPQDDIIHRDLTVRKALDYSARLRMPSDTTREERSQRVQEVLDELDLTGRADVPIRALSGGQRKRASIGVELLTRPSLFFLDEATSGLDPATEAQMMRLLRRLADGGRTVVLVTHATKNVMMCDKVVFLAKGGRLAYFGPPQEALAYFGVTDFDEIYERLEAGRAEESEQRYLESRQYLDNVATPLAEAGRLAEREPTLPPRSADPTTGSRKRGPSLIDRVRRVNSVNQFAVLSARYLDIVRKDKKTVVLLLLIAPILGSLDFVTWGRDVFDPVAGSATQAVTMFFISSLITILVGTITSVREIVKENPVYRRERMVCLKVFPYVASKVVVGAMFAVYSAVVLFLFLVLSVDFSHLAAEQLLMLFVAFALGTVSGLMWGLLVSAVAPSEDRAMLLVILVLVPQFVFSGGMVPVADLGTAGQAFGWVTSTRWQLGAFATSAEIKTGTCEAIDMSDCHLPGIEGLTDPGAKRALVEALDSQYGDIFDVDVHFYWLMSVVLIAALLVLIFVLQKRKDRA